jgi:hypothetical protein
MANKVYVSPGVYTSEVDLTFVAQSVGVTTLGLVGETLKGPAFEPVLITNFDEFKIYFGNTSPEKDGNGNPKYELGYVAKSYLQESNQLFVTRVLGLTGYKPYNTFGITTLGGVNVDLDTTPSSSGSTMSTTGVTSSVFYTELSDKYTTDGVTIPAYVSGTSFTNADWFTIGEVPDSATTGLTGTQLDSPIGENNNKNWYNVFFHKSGGTDSTIDSVYSYLFVYSSGSTAFSVTRYTYGATLNTDYANVLVATLRPRGRYVSEVLTLEVTSSAALTLSSTEITTNPLGEFTINVTGATGGAKSFTCSMDNTSSKYIKKVLGSAVFDKSYSDFPVYVHEAYPNLLKNAFQQGWVRGLSTTKVYATEGTNYLTRWDTTLSPMIVSEVRGSTVADLFQVITISDGNDANKLIKCSVQNINLDTGEFDFLVRDFNDTDENMAILEKYTRCSMNPDLPGYIAKKIGTSNTEFALQSKYIMLVMAENAPTDAFPAGFKGFISDSNLSGATLGSVIYKTEYFDAGDVVYYDADGTEQTTNGDKVRKVSLGLSSQEGFEYDSDLFMYKGASATDETFGFHLSVNAASITGTTYKTTPYDLEGTDKGILDGIAYRKFTFAVCGGFDGWDIYRNVRTNGDGYIFNKATYTSGNTDNNGVFSTSAGNSDYYAYLDGIETFENPEAVNINVFATPGINFFDHSSLTSQAIDMIEGDRADSLYIINTPNVSTADEVVSDLDELGFDSNYSAVYWPWIQVRDVDNATQLYIPPTGEVLRNIALTDNVSYPWFSVAGYKRGLVKSIKAVKKLTAEDRDTLYKNRINPIATFSDTGTVIWGNKTLQVRESALDRINVRRLLLRARKLISAVSVRLLFDQNDDQVRNEFLRLTNPILEAIKKERGLYEFRVTVSNAPEDIDANTLRGKIYIKPTRALEFIELEFVITPTGASFENI